MTDRFKNYATDVRELVLDFEEMLRSGSRHYFDVDQMETIIDFYLETSDIEGVDRSVDYAEVLFPDSNEIRLRRAHQLCAHERYDECYDILRRLERLEPDNTDVLYALGTLYSVREQHRKAIQYYQMASADGYALYTVYGNIGDEYVRMDRCREAISYYKKALEDNPSDERSIYNLAGCYEQEMMDAQCVSYFNAFVERHPYSKFGWHVLGTAYQNQELYEKAIESFDYALTIDNTLYDCYLDKADCYRALGDYGAATATLREAPPHVDDKSGVNHQIATLFMEQRNFVTAAIYLREALKDDPSMGDLWTALAICYSEMGEFEPAESTIQHALDINSNEPAYLVEAARIYARFGHSDEAEQMFEQAVRLVDDNDDYWTDYADFLMNMKRYDDAIDVLNRGLKNAAEPFYFNERLAVCYFMTGQRNYLFNAIRSCMSESKELTLGILDACPAMHDDIDVMNLLSSN